MWKAAVAPGIPRADFKAIAGVFFALVEPVQIAPRQHRESGRGARVLVQDGGTVDQQLLCVRILSEAG